MGRRLRKSPFSTLQESQRIAASFGAQVGQRYVRNAEQLLEKTDEALRVTLGGLSDVTGACRFEVTYGFDPLCDPTLALEGMLADALFEVAGASECPWGDQGGYLALDADKVCLLAEVAGVRSLEILRTCLVDPPAANTASLPAGVMPCIAEATLTGEVFALRRPRVGPALARGLAVYGFLGEAPTSRGSQEPSP